MPLRMTAAYGKCFVGSSVLRTLQIQRLTVVLIEEVVIVVAAAAAAVGGVVQFFVPNLSIRAPVGALAHTIV